MIQGQGRFGSMRLDVAVPNEHSNAYTVTFLYGAAAAAGPGERAELYPSMPEMKFMPRESELVLTEANNFDKTFTHHGEPITLDEFEAEARRAIRETDAGDTEAP